MKMIIILKLVILFFISNGLADTIFLKNGKQFQGELLKVTSKYLIIETMQNLKLVNLSFDREEVSQVVDESKKVLYEHGQLKVKKLKSFYSMTLFSKSRNPKHKFVLQNDRIIYGEITGIYDDRLKIKEDQTSKNLSRIIYFVQIKLIDGKPFESYNLKFISDHYIRVNTFPKISFEIVPSLLFTNLSTLQKKMQGYLDREYPDKNFRVDKINDAYFGMQLSFLVKFTSILTASLTGHFLFTGSENTYHLFISEFRGYFSSGFFRPWVSVGWASQSIHLKGDLHSQSAKYVWSTQENAPSFGAGFETGDAAGAAFFASIRYLGFEKKNINSKIYNLSNENNTSGKIDLSAILLSLGLQINF